MPKEESTKKNKHHGKKQKKEGHGKKERLSLSYLTVDEKHEISTTTTTTKTTPRDENPQESNCPPCGYNSETGTMLTEDIEQANLGARRQRSHLTSSGKERHEKAKKKKKTAKHGDHRLAKPAPIQQKTSSPTQKQRKHSQATAPRDIEAAIPGKMDLNNDLLSSPGKVHRKEKKVKQGNCTIAMPAKIRQKTSSPPQKQKESSKTSPTTPQTWRSTRATPDDGSNSISDQDDQDEHQIFPGAVAMGGDTDIERNEVTIPRGDAAPTGTKINHSRAFSSSPVDMSMQHSSNNLLFNGFLVDDPEQRAVPMVDAKPFHGIIWKRVLAGLVLLSILAGAVAGVLSRKPDPEIAGVVVEDEFEPRITVSLQLGEYPQEIGWELSCDGEVVAEQPVGSYLTSFELIQKSFDVEEGSNCTFRIVNRNGDGLCCKYGQGFYTIQLGVDLLDPNSIVAAGSDFGQEERSRFTVTRTWREIDTLKETPPYSDDTHAKSGDVIAEDEFEVAIYVSLQVDEKSQDIGWQVSCNGELIADRPVGSYLPPLKFVEEFFYVLEGSLCTFRIESINGNGNDPCSVYDDCGYLHYRVYAEIDFLGLQKTFVEGSYFGHEQESRFTVATPWNWQDIYTTAATHANTQDWTVPSTFSPTTSADAGTVATAVPGHVVFDL